ncbi:hypothetical protein FGO68_gene2432 [Halteria grandinella]|uniref:Uncharacterized protein n=1 Tax=Halteria grandinella TaxID=5974 RepID=A0A8J8NPM1_HALGN|nr:hypothetical protein FGO68_gene2432 [Halteria grandinella]
MLEMQKGYFDRQRAKMQADFTNLYEKMRTEVQNASNLLKQLKSCRLNSLASVFRCRKSTSCQQTRSLGWRKPRNRGAEGCPFQ